MNLDKLWWWAALGMLLGCGSANGGSLTGGTGGAGGEGGAGGAGGSVPPPIVDQSTFRISCDFDTLELNLPIELIVELSEPYSNSSSTEATFSSIVTLDEASVASFLDAGVDVIDIVSVSITTNVRGAVPAAMRSSYSGPALNDVDLLTDTDNNGIPGPHQVALDPITTTSTATADATEVEFDLRFGGISIVLGDFSIPANCFGPSLVGIVLTFPVES